MTGELHMEGGPVDEPLNPCDTCGAAEHNLRANRAEGRVYKLTAERDALREALAAAVLYMDRFADFIELDMAPTANSMRLEIGTARAALAKTE